MHAIIDRQAAEITDDVAAANGTTQWTSKLQAMKDWLDARANAIDALYLEKPRFEADGHIAVPGDEVELLSPGGTVYYTTDGTDPRIAGGAISPNAIESPGSMANALTLVAPDATASAIVPDAAFDATFGITWNGQLDAFDDSAAAGWIQGQQGIGYDENDTYQPYLGLDLLDEMSDINGSFYARIQFVLDDDYAPFDFVQLNMRYDDGFIAYLNGTEVARANAPANVTWDATAAVSHRDSDAVEFEVFDVTTVAASRLKPGTNVLAIHGLNRRATDNDMLIQAELLAGQFTRTKLEIAAAGNLIARCWPTADGVGQSYCRLHGRVMSMATVSSIRPT